MGKKSTPAQPTAPDPVATANAQASANTRAAITQANLNRIDQVTPQGSITYNQIGTNSDGTPRYQQVQTYSPGQQALYDQQNQIAQSLGGLARQNVQRVQQAQSTPFNFDGMTPLQTSIPGGGQLQYGVNGQQAQTQVGNAGQVQSGYNAGGGIQTSFGTAGPLTSNVQAGGVQNQIAGAGNVQGSVAGGNYATSIAGAGDVTRGVQGGQIQNGLDFGQSFNPGNFNEAAQQASNSAYQAAAARLDPQFAQQESDFKARLANSGISENSDAYRRELDNFNRAKTDAYGQAQSNAYSAGLAAQQQGYNQALGTRQQQVGETTTAGNFANAAQNQGFQQAQQNAALNNSAQGQVFGQNAAQAQQQNAGTAAQFNQNLQQGQFANNAQGQIFGQNAQQLAAFNSAQQQQFAQGTTNAQLNNAAQGQQFTQNQQAAQFGNAAQQQQNTQNQQQAAFGNAAQDQRYQQNLSNAGFYNQGVSQNFQQGQQNAALNNTAQNQQFNQNAANVTLNNQARQQQIDEAAYLRNIPLNDIAALLGTGGGVQNPNFSNFAQVGVAAPDYQGAVYANYNAANQQYNAAQQARSQGLGSIFGLAGTLGAAAISDMRAKANIRRIGTLANGLATYVYNYVGSAAKQFGVMAQEALNIVPEAVGVTRDGTLYVNYGKVW